MKEPIMSLNKSGFARCRVQDARFTTQSKGYHGSDAGRTGDRAIVETVTSSPVKLSQTNQFNSPRRKKICLLKTNAGPAGTS